MKFDYGMREKNPVESVLFYKKKEPEKAVSRVTKEPVSLTCCATSNTSGMYEQLNLCVDMHTFWIS